MMHKFFDKGIFYLIPRPASDFDTQTGRDSTVWTTWVYASCGFRRIQSGSHGQWAQSFAPQA